MGTGIMSDGDRVHDGLGCCVCGLKRVKNKKKPFLGQRRYCEGCIHEWRKMINSEHVFEMKL
jgi:hypothetical protein